MTIAKHNDEYTQVIQEMLEIAGKHGVNLNPEGIEMTESGMDFLVGFAEEAGTGARWILRKPRRSDVLERAGNEARVLKLIPSYLPVDVPDWRIYTPELIAYPLLSGEPAASVSSEGYAWNMDHENPGDEFVRSLAETLVSLHGIDHDAARAAGLRVKSPQEVREETARNMEDIKSRLGVSDALWERWQKWLEEDSYWPTHSALIHGDLHPPHILIDERVQVTGLLDWTESEVASPAKDFVLYYAIYGEHNLRVLLDRYKQAGGKVWPRMFDHIVEQHAAYPVLIAQFALLTGQEEYMTMARNALGLTEEASSN
ncbi:macrolide 2'-phosphotransferase MphI [Paenibacillus lautus]|uniref:macrolide 2'-phosphotransferase MphI n=1 Tax=Paenibacillus lautus TaxID=1401 RepID=UPI003D2655F0